MNGFVFAYQQQIHRDYDTPDYLLDECFTAVSENSLVYEIYELCDDFTQTWREVLTINL